MLIYIVIYTLLLLCFFFEKDNVRLSDKKVVLAWLVLILTLFRGLRWDTGTDWDQYLSVFKVADWSNIFSFSRNSSTHMEPGYMLINVLVKTIGGGYTLFLLLTNFFVLYAYQRFALTNSTSPIFVFVLIIFSTQFFPVRIGIAVGVILLGLTNFSDKKFRRAIFFTLIAATIHSSAVIFIPIYCSIYIKKFPTLLAVIIAVVWMEIASLPAYNTFLFTLAGGLNFLGDETAHKFENYLDYGLTQSNRIVIAGYLSSTIFILLLWIFGKMLDKKSPALLKDHINYDFLYNVYFVFMMIAIAFPGERMAGLRRLQNFFMFAFPVLFSVFIVNGKKKYPSYSIYYTFAIIGYAVFRAYSLFYGRDPEVHFPYKSILDHAF